MDKVTIKDLLQQISDKSNQWSEAEAEGFKKQFQQLAIDAYDKGWKDRAEASTSRHIADWGTFSGKSLRVYLDKLL